MGKKGLGASEIRKIRQRIANGESQTAVAGDLGISQSAVSRIARGERRTRVPNEEGLGTYITRAEFFEALIFTALSRKGGNGEALTVVRNGD